MVNPGVRGWGWLSFLILTCANSGWTCSELIELTLISCSQTGNSEFVFKQKFEFVASRNKAWDYNTKTWLALENLNPGKQNSKPWVQDPETITAIPLPSHAGLYHWWDSSVTPNSKLFNMQGCCCEGAYFGTPNQCFHNPNKVFSASLWYVKESKKQVKMKQNSSRKRKLKGTNKMQTTAPQLIRLVITHYTASLLMQTLQTLEQGCYLSAASGAADSDAPGMWISCMRNKRFIRCISEI